MNEREPNFEPLRKLLAAKRHENPPPGYFDDFSSQVVSRIRLGEAKQNDGLATSLFSEAPWILRFLRIFEAKPAFAGVFASVLFLLLVAGIVYTDHPQAVPDSLMPDQTAQTGQPAQGGAALASMSSSFLSQSLPSTDLDSSTNPVMSLQPVSSSFGSSSELFQPAVYTH